MAVRKRTRRWPSWTTTERATPPASKRTLTEPLRSTLRRIDEQFLSINNIVLEAYQACPQLGVPSTPGLWPMLEQDAPYLDGLGEALALHEDTALLGRLSDLVCPEAWAAFFADVGRLARCGEAAPDAPDADEWLAGISRRKTVASELYGCVHGDVRERGLGGVSRGVEVKIALLAVLLTVNGASVSASGPIEAGGAAGRRAAERDPLLAWGVPSRSADSAVHHLSQNDVATLIAITSLTVVLSTLLSVPAWIYSRGASGHAKPMGDADFWTLAQNTSMQLLGIFTAVYPMRRQPLANLSAGGWVRAFAVMGTIATLCALPVYLYASSFWSSVLAFLGAAAQAFLVLQLALLAIATPARQSDKRD